jgi:SPP1 gp7 family putative phage head morphogenesis protein
MDKAHRDADKLLVRIEKRLVQIYSDVGRELEELANEYLRTFRKNDAVMRDLVRKGQITNAEYKAWRKKKLMHGKRFTDMKRQCAEGLLRANEAAAAYINGNVPDVYVMSYNAFKGAVEGVKGYSFTLVDAETVRVLAVSDKSLLPLKVIDPAKDIPWNMRNINTAVLEGIIRGDSIPKIAKRIRDVQGMNRDASVRSARTIVTGAENKGRQDSYAKAEAEGIILQKRWISTHDSRTRDTHLALDKVTVDQNEAFGNGLMYPGDPNGRPEEVYNCRCTLAAVVKGFKKVT